MCFVVMSNKELTAKKDIICYKFLEIVDEDSGMLVSPYKDHVYFLGETYKLSKKLRIKKSGDYDSIEEGLHSCNSCIIKIWGDRPSFLRKCSLFQCTIPKGAKYYKNSKEYVSDAITINKKIS